MGQDQDYAAKLIARYKQQAEEKRQEAVKREPLLAALPLDEQIRELRTREAERYKRLQLAKARRMEAKAKAEAAAEAAFEKFSETYILRLMRTKPAKLKDCLHATQVLQDLREFYRYVRCSKDSYIENGWNTSGFSISCYGMTISKITKLKVLLEDVEARVNQLKADERQQAESLRRSKIAARQLVRAGQDGELASALWHALENTPPTVGFVYLKRWEIPDGSCWFKVGITNDPNRREVEQNVLPVAAETIACIDVGSMDRARAIEAVIHRVLDEQRITDANNRELFHLSDQQAAAVKAVLEKLC